MDEFDVAPEERWLMSGDEVSYAAIWIEQQRIIRELKDAALYAVERPAGTRWYLDIEDAIAIVRGQRDE